MAGPVLFDYIQSQYQLAVDTGKVPAFNQELMLRLTSDDSRLILDSDIRWYKRAALLERKGNYNFYITTDIAVSAKQKADRTVISVWAYNSNGDLFWVDGICARQTVDKTWDDLFRLAQAYRPMSVGIEVTGQQLAFIKILQGEMLNRNVWFNFASSEKNNEPGIRPQVDKLSRLNTVVPWFKSGKIYFPEEMKATVIMGEFMGELRLATTDGLKGKDDCIDTVSMLGFMRLWKPGDSGAVPKQSEGGMWDEERSVDLDPRSSYHV